MTAWEIIKEREGIVRTNAYQLVNIRTRVKMLTFFKRDGTTYSANYSHLYCVESTVDGLRLDFGKVKIVIKGDALEKMHRGLVEHRVTYMKERMEKERMETGEAVIHTIIIMNLAEIRSKAEE